MMTKKNCSKLIIGKSSIKPIHHPKRNYDKILLYSKSAKKNYCCWITSKKTALNLWKKNTFFLFTIKAFSENYIKNHLFIPFPQLPTAFGTTWFTTELGNAGWDEGRLFFPFSASSGSYFSVTCTHFTWTLLVWMSKKNARPE